MYDETEEQTLPEINVETRGALSPQAVPFGLLNSAGPQYRPSAPVQQQPQGFSNPLAGQGGLLLAMAGGIDKNGPMGGAMRAASDHFILQDQLKDTKEQRALQLKLQQDKLDESKRLNDSKISAYASKALKEGMPKKIGGAQGQTTLLWPNGDITSHADEEVQKIAEQMEAGKTTRAALIANGQLQGKILANPENAKYDAELDAQVGSAQEAHAEFQRVKKQFDDMGGMPEWINLPGAEWVAKKADTKEGALLKSLQGLTLDSFLNNIRRLPGAASDKEGDKLSGPLPQPGDGPGIWKQWFDTNGPKIERMMNRAEAVRDDRKARMASIMAQPSSLNGGVASAPQAPAPAGTPAAALPSPAAVQAADAAPKSSQPIPGKAGKMMTQHADFPKITPEVQAGRDQGRLQILMNDYKKVVAAGADKVDPEAFEAMKKEIKRLGGDVDGPAKSEAPAARKPLSAFKK